MMRNSNLALYLAKIETTEGTDAAPTAAANAIALVQNIDPDYDFAYKHERDTMVRGADSIDAAPPLPPAGANYNWTKQAWLRGLAAAPTAANPVELDAWLRSAGFAVTYDATAGSEKAVYTPAMSGLESLTEYFYHDGLLRKGLGARAVLNLSFDAGGPIIVEHASQGVFGGISDSAVPADPDISDVLPPVAVGMTFSVDGFATGCIRRFTLGTGATITQRPCVKAPDGIASVKLDKRKWAWTVVLEEPKLSEHDFYALQKSLADVAIAWTLSGGQYNTFDFSAAKAKVEKVTPSNDNGNALITLSGGIYGDLSLTVK